MFAAPGVGGINSDHVQVSPQFKMLKPVIENEDVRIEIGKRPFSSGKAIGIADHCGLTPKILSEYARFVTGHRGICQNLITVRDDNSAARVVATITTSKDADLLTIPRKRMRDIVNQRSLAGATRS